MDITRIRQVYPSVPTSEKTQSRVEFQAIVDDDKKSPAQKYCEIELFNDRQNFKEKILALEEKIAQSSAGDLFLLRIRNKGFKRIADGGDKVADLMKIVLKGSPELAHPWNDHWYGRVALTKLQFIVRGSGMLFPNSHYTKSEEAQAMDICIDVGHDSLAELNLLLDSHWMHLRHEGEGWIKETEHLCLHKIFEPFNFELMESELMIGDEVTAYAKENNLSLPEL